MNSARRAWRGQAIVETALVLPLLLFVSLGLLQFALYTHARDVLLLAAQDGARLAAEDGRSLDDGLTRVAALTAAGLGSTVDDLHTVCAFDGDAVRVTVTGSLRPILPLPLADGLPLQVQSSVARERFRPGGR